MVRYPVPALVLAVVVALSLAIGVQTWRLHQAATRGDTAVAALLVKDAQARGLAATVATTRLNRDQYRLLLETAETRHALILAAVTLQVQKRDTALVHDTLPTSVSADSVRVAKFRDSTFAGVVEGTVTAPPCCAALGIRYTLTRFPFAPKILFAQTGDAVVALVDWNGEHVSATHVFADLHVQSPRWQRVLSVDYGVPDGMRAQGEVQLRLLGSLHAAVGVEQHFQPGRGARAFAGAQLRF